MPPITTPVSTMPRIDDLHQVTDPAGRPFWKARLTVNGVTVRVTRRYGSWMIADGTQLRDVPPSYAVLLQDEVRATERAARGPRRPGQTVEVLSTGTVVHLHPGSPA